MAFFGKMAMDSFSTKKNGSIIVEKKNAVGQYEGLMICRLRCIGLIAIPDLNAELIADLNAICAICRSYIGHIWAIHKLYISHVQPTVQATEGP